MNILRALKFHVLVAASIAICSRQTIGQSLICWHYDDCYDAALSIRMPFVASGPWELFEGETGGADLNGSMWYSFVIQGGQVVQVGNLPVDAEVRYLSPGGMGGQFGSDYKYGTAGLSGMANQSGVFETMGSPDGFVAHRDLGQDACCGAAVKGAQSYGFIMMITGFKPDRDPCANVGDPINVLDGNVSERESDIVLRTPGPALEWRRAYNSLRTNVSAMGANWLHSYDWRVSRVANSISVITNQCALVQSANGSRFGFFQNNAGAWRPLFDCSGVLSENAGAFTWRSMDGLSYHFDTNGVLESVADDWGNAVHCVYSGSYPTQRLEIVAHTCGLSLEIGYDNGRISSVSTPSTALSVQYTYDAAGAMTSSATDDGAEEHTTTYQYCDHTNVVGNCMTQRVDATGVASSWEYATNATGEIDGRAIRARVASGDYLDARVSAFGSNGNQTVVSYMRGATTNAYLYTYSTNLMRLMSISVPNSFNSTQKEVATSFTYNKMLKPASTFEFEGGYTIDTRIQYENSGLLQTNVTQQLWTPWTPTGWVPAAWSYAWDTNKLVVTNAVDPEGITTELGYINGSLYKVRSSAGGTNAAITSFGYTTNGWLTGMTNANGAWMNIGYDSQGFVTAVVPALGPSITISNDALGRPVHFKRTDGVTITLERNGAGLVTRADYPLGLSESFQYDGTGMLTNYVDTAGRTNAFSWLFGGHLASATHVVSPTSSVSVGFGYDQQLNLRSVTDELGRTVEAYGLDSRDRVVTVTNLEGQTMSVSYLVKKMIGSVGRFDGTQVSLQYDPQGNPTNVVFPSVSDSYQWYRNGFLVRAANEAGVVSNEMDTASGRLLSSKSAAPLGDVFYTHFPAGQPASMESIAGTTTYGLDAADRLTQIDGPFARASITYNPTNGRIDTLAYSNGVSARYEWDALDRLGSIQWLKGTQELRRLDYGYNAASLITNIARENGHTAYGYDALDRLASETVFASSATSASSAVQYSYDLAGNRTSKQTDGIGVNYTTGTGNKLTGWSVTGSISHLSVSVMGGSSEMIGTNDYLGKLEVSGVATTRPSFAGTNFWALSFPAVPGTQQVVAAIRDSAGNVGYATNAFTVALVTNATYGYNAAGCVTSISYHASGGVALNQTLVWNDRYQLTAVKTNGATAESYTYDAIGRRASITAGGQTMYFVYDGPHVVADVDAGGNPVRSYTYGPGIDNILSMTVHGATNRTYYYLKDPLNTVLALADEAGNIVESYEYDAWGRVLSVQCASGSPLAQSALGNRYLFQGRELSWANGLYHFRARWYDPALGRWISQDPIGISGGLNVYVFAYNKPTDYCDPLGLSGKSVGMNDLPGSPSNPIKLDDNAIQSLLGEAYSNIKNGNANNPLTTDTVMYYNSNNYYQYGGKTYSGAELNYIGVGMWFAWLQVPYATARGEAIAWNRCRYGQGLPAKASYWFTRGYVGFNPMSSSDKNPTPPPGTPMPLDPIFDPYSPPIRSPNATP